MKKIRLVLLALLSFGIIISTHITTKANEHKTLIVDRSTFKLENISISHFYTAYPKQYPKLRIFAQNTDEAMIVKNTQNKVQQSNIIKNENNELSNISETKAEQNIENQTNLENNNVNETVELNKEEIKYELPNYTIEKTSEYTVYTISDLNLREGPGIEYSIKTSVGFNTPLIVIGKTINNWIQVIYENNEYFCNMNYTSSEKIYIETNNESTENSYTNNPYYNVVKSEDSSTKDVTIMANKFWNEKIPDNIKKQIIDNEWSIVISSESLKDRFGYDMSIAGLTSFICKTIYLENKESAVEKAFFHEVGHVIDSINDFPSSTNEFSSLFAKEKYDFKSSKAIGDNHEISNLKEYFAEIFQEIFINSENCAKQIPESYNYVLKYTE